MTSPPDIRRSERLGLHPLAPTFALMAFGQSCGCFGILVALPASAAQLVGLRDLRGMCLADHSCRGR